MKNDNYKKLNIWKKRIKKYILTIGTLPIVLAPIAVVSCGFKKILPPISPRDILTSKVNAEQIRINRIHAGVMPGNDIADKPFSVFNDEKQKKYAVPIGQQTQGLPKGAFFIYKYSVSNGKIIISVSISDTKIGIIKATITPFGIKLRPHDHATEEDAHKAAEAEQRRVNKLTAQIMLDDHDEDHPSSPFSDDEQKHYGLFDGFSRKAQVKGLPKGISFSYKYSVSHGKISISVTVEGPHTERVVNRIKPKPIQLFPRAKTLEKIAISKLEMEQKRINFLSAHQMPDNDIPTSEIGEFTLSAQTKYGIQIGQKTSGLPNGDTFAYHYSITNKAIKITVSILGPHHNVPNKIVPTPIHLIPHGHSLFEIAKIKIDAEQARVNALKAGQMAEYEVVDTTHENIFDLAAMQRYNLHLGHATTGLPSKYSFVYKYIINSRIRIKVSIISNDASTMPVSTVDPKWITLHPNHRTAAEKAAIQRAKIEAAKKLQEEKEEREIQKTIAKKQTIKLLIDQEQRRINYKHPSQFLSEAAAAATTGFSTYDSDAQQKYKISLGHSPFVDILPKGESFEYVYKVNAMHKIKIIVHINKGYIYNHEINEGKKIPATWISLTREKPKSPDEKVDGHKDSVKQFPGVPARFFDKDGFFLLPQNLDELGPNGLTPELIDKIRDQGSLSSRLKYIQNFYKPSTNGHLSYAEQGFTLAPVHSVHSSFVLLKVKDGAVIPYRSGRGIVPTVLTHEQLGNLPNAPEAIWTKAATGLFIANQQFRNPIAEWEKPREGEVFIHMRTFGQSLIEYIKDKSDRFSTPPDSVVDNLQRGAFLYLASKGHYFDPKNHALVPTDRQIKDFIIKKSYGHITTITDDRLEEFKTESQKPTFIF